MADSLGKVAYQAYGNNRDWKDYRGNPMPAWEGLSNGINQAWEVAAAAAVSAADDSPKAEDWRKQFDERQQRQIKWATQYATPEFSHGDDGHNSKLIIAKMAKLLDGNTV